MVAHCAVRRPGGRTCGAVLRFVTDRIGHVHEVCDRCAHRQAGICSDCPRPVDGTVGKADRCAECRSEAARRADAAWYHRNLGHARALGRARRHRGLLKQGRTPMTRAEACRKAALASSRVRLERVPLERRREIARMGGLATQAKRRAQQERAA